MTSSHEITENVVDALSETWEYEVFLSFCGTDTRTSFTDFLYEDLVGAGIRAFRDNNELPIGKTIGPELFKAIEQSKIYIPILSQNYAYSKWCLRELTLMVEKVKEKNDNRFILPIFYDIEPCHVKHQTGKYCEAFYEHEKNNSVETHVIQQWKEALRYVGTVKGWEVKKTANGHQGRLVKKVVSQVSTELNNAFLDVTENLVGIDDQVREVIKLLDVNHNDVRIVGIHGMGGIGKTTLAKSIYNQLSNEFQHRSFLTDVKEKSQNKGIIKLQNQLTFDMLSVKVSNVDHGVEVLSERLRSKKVLILIDDVDHKNQLDMLARKPNWFGPGSRIIITTRNKQILDEFEVNMTYEVKELDFNSSLQLFSKYAFKMDNPPQYFLALSRTIVYTTRGLPLSIKVISSLLRNKDEKVWLDTLKKLSKIPEQEVFQTLRISYEALEDWQKEMFLDIACLFIGKDKTIVSYMWESLSDCYPEYGITVLVNMSLVKIDENNKLFMHNQLRDLGKEVVRQAKDKNLGIATRLSCYEEAFDVLKGKRKDTELVKALCLGTNDTPYATGKCRFKSNELTNFSNLIYLQAGYTDLCGNFKGLLPELRWLQWSVQIENSWMSKLCKFCPRKLVILDLSYSKVSEKWKGWRLIKESMHLKVLNLSYCERLKRTPKFPRGAQLERLILTGCKSLVKIDPSICYLEFLILLDLKDCPRLERLPSEMCSQVMLDATNVESTQSIQKHRRIHYFTSLGSMKLCGSNQFLYPNGSMHELQGPLDKLQSLNLRHCECIRSLPESIGVLEMLIEVDLGNTSLSTLPKSIGNLKTLRVLIVCNSLLSKFPNSIWNLEMLEVLDAYGCKFLEGDITFEVGRLSCLKILRLGLTKIHSLPESITRLPQLQELDLHQLNLDPLPELPPTLTRLSACCSTMNNEISHLSKLTNLQELNLDQGDSPRGIDALPTEIGHLSQLKQLSISSCQRLQCLPSLPTSLVKLQLLCCYSMENLGDLSNLKYLNSLVLVECPVQEIQGLHALKSLTELCLCKCQQLHKLDGIEQLTHLRELYICCCKSLKNLPDLSSLSNLRTIHTHGCDDLNIQGIHPCECMSNDPLRSLDFCL